MVNADMVCNPGELENVHNELRFYVELASPCTNLLNYINISILQLSASARQRYRTIALLYQKFFVFTVHKSA